jgi:ABC-type dipeptide/oligopeptide/nickel transport system ATPase component
MLLEADLEIRYRNRTVVRRARLTMAPGEILGLAGPSGGGKSSIAMALLGLLGWRGGTAHGVLRFRGCDLLSAGERAMRAMRGREIALVPQSPIASLNPSLRLSSHFREAWKAHACGDWRSRALSLFERVSLPADAEFLRRYPAELSVGQAQRVLIALALLHEPALLIADEATSALDPVTQAEILDLFGSLNRERGAAILYISHDLSSLAALCHRVAVLYEGEIVECGDVKEIFEAPEHPYTRSLVGAHQRLLAV